MLVKVEKIKRSKMSVPVRNGEQRTGKRAGVNGAENPRQRRGRGGVRGKPGRRRPAVCEFASLGKKCQINSSYSFINHHYFPRLGSN